MIEESSSDRHRAIVTEVHFLRGAIVSSYAHVEFLLGDLCMKAWYTADYSHLRGKFPYRLEARIRSSRDLFLSDGPFSRYASEVEGLFERLATYEEYRHFMAHGLCMVTPTDMPLIQLRLWRPTKQGAEEGTINLTIEQMRDNATEITAYCNQVIRLLHKVYTEQKLEIPAEAFSATAKPESSVDG